MKTKLKILLLSLACCISLAGCTTSNPDYQPLPADQNPTTNPQFIPNTGSISNAAYTAHTINNATAPVNPYSAPTGVLIDAVAALVTAGSLLFAKVKSSQAAKHQSAMNTMALGIVAAGNAAADKVKEVASNTSDFAHVADTLNNHTP